jgi:repressor LexA
MAPKTTLKSLTPKQKQVLEFIQHFSQEHGYAPSQKEIAAHFGFSSLGTVQNYLVRLQEAEFLEKTWNGKRTLTLTKSTPAKASSDVKNFDKKSVEGFTSLEVPLLGKVAAGAPIEHYIHNESITIPAQLFSHSLREQIYALKVQGDSMIDDGILDGDIVLIRKADRAENGQRVVALIDNEATIKTYFRKKDVIELRPANPRYKPILVKDEESFRIEGVFVGLIRRS